MLSLQVFYMKYLFKKEVNLSVNFRSRYNYAFVFLPYWFSHFLATLDMCSIVFLFLLPRFNNRSFARSYFTYHLLSIEIDLFIKIILFFIYNQIFSTCCFLKYHLWVKIINIFFQEISVLYFLANKPIFSPKAKNLKPNSIIALSFLVK